MEHDPPPAEMSELEELRLRVAAQGRLIESIRTEIEDIHDLRRRTHDAEEQARRVMSLPGIRQAAAVRRRLLGQRDPTPD